MVILTDVGDTGAAKDNQIPLARYFFGDRGGTS
jgi:hypothetical protein